MVKILHSGPVRKMAGNRQKKLVLFDSNLELLKCFSLSCLYHEEVIKIKIVWKMK